MSSFKGSIERMERNRESTDSLTRKRKPLEEKVKADSLRIGCTKVFVAIPAYD